MNNKKYTYSYPYRYTKTALLVICLTLMANATYFNNLISFNMKYTKDDMKKNGFNIDEIIDKIKEVVSQNLEGIDVNCINNQLDKLKNLDLELSLVLGTHKIIININIKALGLKLNIEEEFIYYEYLNNKKDLENKINSIMQTIINKFKKEFIILISSVTYVPKGILNKYNIPITIPECFTNPIGRVIYKKIKEQDTTSSFSCLVEGFRINNNERRRMENIGIPSDTINNPDNENDLVILNDNINSENPDIAQMDNAIIRLNLSDDVVETIVDNLNIITRENINKYLDTINNTLCKLDNIDGNVNITDENFKPINMVLTVLVCFFAFFLVTCLNITIMALLMYFKNPRTFLYQILSYFQLLFMIILTVLFLVLSYYKFPMIPKETYDYLEIIPEPSGILLFVSTGLFLINKFFISRKRFLNNK